MGWETKGDKRYYYRKKRVGGRIVSEYVGSGDIGEQAERADREAKQRRKAESEQLRRTKEEIRELDQQIKQSLKQVKAALGAVLETSGYHYHKGEWRKQRDMTAIVKPKRMVVKPVLQQAIIGKMIKSIASDEKTSELVSKQCFDIREGLGYLEASGLEQLLIDQVVICWLRSQIANSSLTAYIQMGDLKAAEFFDRHTQRSQNAFLKACESLAKVRKLAKRDVALQVNIASQQVNQVNG